MTSAARLSWVGSRCWTRTNAMPLSAGTALKNLRNASRPPADAPIPTSATRASLLRPADATPAARGAFRVERRGLVVRLRPRPMRFIGPVVGNYHAETPPDEHEDDT